MSPYVKKVCALLSAGLLVLMSATALAEISPIVFRIEATNASGTGFFEVNSNQLVYNPVTGIHSWSQLTPVPLVGPQGVVAMLNSATLALRSDPQINLGFVVQAGQTNTQFVIQSALLSFPTIPASVAEGRASAAIGVTDVNGDGATLNALPPFPKAYLAQYNGFVPNGTTFSNLITSVTAGPGGSGAVSENDPPVGYRPVGANVNDMSAQVTFTLTATDLASGTTNYEIIPEPAGLGLMVFGALLVLRRR